MLVREQLLLKKMIVLIPQVYKRKTEMAKKEYLKALAAYRANQISQVRSCECTQLDITMLLNYSVNYGMIQANFQTYSACCQWREFELLFML